jgi:hypothetical protein
MNRLLACDTFVAGYTRAFTSTAEPHRGFTVKIYEFGRPAGAARYAATDLRGTLRQQPGLVDNLPIGHLITLNNADTFGNRVALVIGAVGPYVYVVRLFAHSEPDPTEVRAIAERQHRQLTQPTPSSA